MKNNKILEKEIHIKEEKELRNVLVEKLDNLMEKDKNIVILDADLMGSLGTAKLKTKFNDRIINCGIMEAQEISCASGMAKLGLKPFVHTFTSFATRRCLDQIFISSLYQKTPITIIASDPGIQAVHNGGTHMSFEDLAIMRSLVGTNIIEPTDSTVLNAVLDEINKNPDFYYIRLTRKNVFKIYNENSEIKIGKANILKKGKDITIIAMGLMVHESLKAAKELEKEGIDVTVIDMFTLKPLDKEIIIEYAKKSKLIITAENHNITNGLGSAIAEVLSENSPTKLIRIGVENKFGQVGTLEYLQQVYGLNSETIIKKIKENI